MTTLKTVTIALLLVATGCDENRLAVDLGGKRFNLEVAATDEQIRQGLMHRDKLADDGGMIFIFPDQKHRSFWMKNCKIDLDIIFFDGSGTIVNIQTMRHPRTPQENENPPSYRSGLPARFAIEINAGMADKLGLKVEDKPDLPIDRIKALTD